jgi:hypothetical protein
MMVIVQCANRRLKVSEEEIPFYLDQGYSVIDTYGQVVKSGARDYDALLAENKRLMAELEAIKARPRKTSKK